MSRVNHILERCKYYSLATKVVLLVALEMSLINMEIALCLSGGGYRASIYHLGVISFLCDLKTNDDSPFINNVHTITSISGGALTGMLFLLSEIDRKNRRETISRIYHDIVETNIGDLLLERFHEDAKEGKALVQSLAAIYDNQFFKGETFSKILDGVSWDGIHHYYADATDFELGLPFRFQATAPLSVTHRNEPYGMIGNWRHQIKRELARQIKLSDIMAATSCFPIVFEPFLFPQEFNLNNSVKSSTDIPGGFPLMDGGLIDNQGVDPALHAASHLAEEGKEMDLLLICDAGNDSDEGAEKEWNLWKITPKTIFITSAFLGIACLTLGCDLIAKKPMISGILLTLSVVFAVVCCVLNWVDKWICSFISARAKLKVCKSPVWSSTLHNIGTFLKSRAISAYRMADAVMSGNQKKLWFRALRTSQQWENKLLMNSLSLFSPKKTWINIFRRQGLDVELRPTTNMLLNTKKAMSMGTTLWFTEEDKKKKLPQAIFACGRYTTCWNLLVYIDRLKRMENVQRTPFQNELIVNEPQIKDFWNRFKQNHFLRVRQYTE